LNYRCNYYWWSDNWGCNYWSGYNRSFNYWSYWCCYRCLDYWWGRSCWSARSYAISDDCKYCTN
jgi:hypothetical protein